MEQFVFPPLALTVPQVAATTAMSQSKIWKLISDGELPVTRVDGSTRVMLDDVREMLLKHRTVQGEKEADVTPAGEPSVAAGSLRQ